MSKFASTDIRIMDFGVLSGIMKTEKGWKEDLADMALAALQLVFAPEFIQKSLNQDPDPLIDAELAAQATRKAWGTYAFGPCPTFLVSATYEMQHKDESGGGKLRFYEWWNLVQVSSVRGSMCADLCMPAELKCRQNAGVIRSILHLLTYEQSW